MEINIISDVGVNIVRVNVLGANIVRVNVLGVNIVLGVNVLGVNVNDIGFLEERISVRLMCWIFVCRTLEDWCLR